MIAKIVGGALVVAIAVAGYVLYDILSAPKPVGTESVIAVEAPAVRKAPRVKVAIKKPVTTIQGPAKVNLKLPDAVQKDPDQQVVAASQVKSDLHPQTISTVVNTESGEVTTFTKVDPYPWLAVETRGEIKLAYGYKYNHVMHQSAPVGRLQLNYDVIRVKSLTAGIMATVDSDSTAFAGVGLSYKW